MAKKKTASQKGRMSRNKGRNFERRIANILKDRGIVARRGVQFNGMFTHDIKTDIPFNFEAKAVENLNIKSAMEQAVTDSKMHNTVPTVVHKKNGKKPLITMHFEDFIDLLQYALGVPDEENTMDLMEIREEYIRRRREEEELL